MVKDDKVKDEMKENRKKLAKELEKERAKVLEADAKLRKVLDEKEPILDEIIQQCREARADLRSGGNASRQGKAISELIKKL